ncbi:hypothetical protein [Streptomyces sp. NPDC002588]|uniref:hypothetical protein n=1 Tax=Streptomyces sp. NPDC002588 TaxID=3154419 RepID=UPI003317F8EC
MAHRFLPGDEPWRELPATGPGGTITGAPAAAFDALGRAVIAVLGADGRLAAARQLAQGSPESGPWTSLG